MSKKTALDLACEFIQNGGLEMCSLCSIDCKHLQTRRTKNECFKKVKQHFQQQADIPDGWDVVKEIYKHYSKENKELEKEIKSTSEWANKFSEEMAEMLGVSRLSPKCINELANTKLGNLLRRKDTIYWILYYIKDKLDEAGIEVKKI